VSDQHLQQLRDRLGLDRHRPSTDEATNPIQGLTDLVADLAGWVPFRVDDLADASPPSTHAFVRPADRENDDTVFRIDMYELPSAAEAHEHLVRVLADFQSPQLAVLDAEGIGDVAVGHGETALVARRHNVVFVVRNAGDVIAPVLDLGRAVDRAIDRRAGQQGQGG